MTKWSDLTSYDYFAPISESGQTTDKFQITKNILKEYFPKSDSNFRVQDERIVKYPDITKFQPLGSIFELSEKISLWKRRKIQFWSEKPISMELFPRQRGKTSSGQVELKILTLRRPLRHSWRIGVFYGSHGSGMIAIPKRSKNIPHKSTIADFLEHFIFW